MGNPNLKFYPKIRGADILRYTLLYEYINTPNNMQYLFFPSFQVQNMQ